MDTLRRASIDLGEVQRHKSQSQSKSQSAHRFTDRVICGSGLCKPENQNVCKMCAVLQHYLGKETRCASPLHPPGCGAHFGIEPWRTSETDRRFITRTVWSLHHHKREPPRSPLNPMDGARFSLSPIPPSTNRAGWMAFSKISNHSNGDAANSPNRHAILCRHALVRKIGVFLGAQADGLNLILR